MSEHNAFRRRITPAKDSRARRAVRFVLDKPWVRLVDVARNLAARNPASMARQSFVEAGEAELGESGAAKFNRRGTMGVGWLFLLGALRIAFNVVLSRVGLPPVGVADYLWTGFLGILFFAAWRHCASLLFEFE